MLTREQLLKGRLNLATSDRERMDILTETVADLMIKIDAAEAALEDLRCDLCLSGHRPPLSM